MAKNYGADPATCAFAITPDDATVFDNPTRGLYVGSSGNVTVKMMDSGDNITFSNVTGGTTLPIRVVMVYETSTTASDIVGLF